MENSLTAPQKKLSIEYLYGTAVPYILVGVYQEERNENMSPQKLVRECLTSFIIAKK